jgi:uncharacterized protein
MGSVMRIKVLGTESLGVRGLCCAVEMEDRKIIIDPGIALGWRRYGLMPHPFQVAVGAKIRSAIIKELETVTDVVFSHYDGDHVPLADANPYQLSLDMVAKQLSNAKIWAKGVQPNANIQYSRRQAIENTIMRQIPAMEDQTCGGMRFSAPVAHGLREIDSVSVMMVRIEEAGEVFVHASDIQFLHREAIEIILDWKPTIVLSSGPPIYLSRLTVEQDEFARKNAIELSRNVETLIIDHHLLRSGVGLAWQKKIEDQTGNHVISAAEFMGTQLLLLEAWRKKLYEWLPVPDDWHEKYKHGEVDLDDFLERGWDVLMSCGLIKNIITK